MTAGPISTALRAVSMDAIPARAPVQFQPDDDEDRPSGRSRQNAITDWAASRTRQHAIEKPPPARRAAARARWRQLQSHVVGNHERLRTDVAHLGPGKGHSPGPRGRAQFTDAIERRERAVRQTSSVMLLKNLMKTQRGPNWVDDSVRPNQLPYQDPTALLGPAKATEHAQSFRDGAHAFVPDWAFNHIGGFFGGWGAKPTKKRVRVAATSSALKDEAQSTITTADDEGKTGVAKLERGVGLEEGSWSNNGAINHIYRFHVDPSL